MSFNAISIRNVQGIPLAEMPLEDFTGRITTATTTHFFTATAARRMTERGSSIILTLSASAARLSGSDRRFHLTGDFGVAYGAIEALSRSLA